MRYLQTMVERGINQSPRAATIQYWSNWAVMLMGAVFAVTGVFERDYFRVGLGAFFQVMGLVGHLRSEVYAIARLLVAAAKA